MKARWQDLVRSKFRSIDSLKCLFPEKIARLFTEGGHTGGEETQSP